MALGAEALGVPMAQRKVVLYMSRSAHDPLWVRFVSNYRLHMGSG